MPFFHDREDPPARPVWSLLWRMILFGPILWMVGLLILPIAFVVAFGPALYGSILLIDENYISGIVLMIASFFWLRIVCRRFPEFFEGVGHSSL